MIKIEFTNRYEEEKLPRKVVVQKVSGIVQSIKYFEEINENVPDLVNKKLIFVIGGQEFDYSTMDNFKILIKEPQSKYYSDISNHINLDNEDGLFNYLNSVL